MSRGDAQRESCKILQTFRMMEQSADNNGNHRETEKVHSRRKFETMDSNQTQVFIFSALETH